MSPASGHHVGVKPLAFVDHAGGKVPTYGHHVGKKPANGYHSKYQPLDIMLGRNPSMGIISEHSSFSVSSSLKNETNPEHSFILCFKLVKK
jgi:hypothetical protein